MPDAEKKSRYKIADHVLPHVDAVKILPANFVCVEAGQHGNFKQVLRIVKAFQKLILHERARCSTKLSKTPHAAMASAYPTDSPDHGSRCYIDFSRYTSILDAQALLQPEFKNDVDKLLDSMLNCCPSTLGSTGMMKSVVSLPPGTLAVSVFFPVHSMSPGTNLALFTCCKLTLSSDYEPSVLILILL
jgi:hypothetical protein